LNAATDNPIIFPDGGDADPEAVATGHGRVISGGNFHGEPIALGLDFAKIAIAELGSISERRTANLVDPNLNSGLPAFLGGDSGLEAGLMILQYTAAALASENKSLAHPASVDSIPTSGNQEDHVSMGPIAGRQARVILEHVERILAIELLCAARGLDLRLASLPGTVPGAGVAAAHRAIREVSPPWTGDREPGPELEAVTRLVREGRLAPLASPPTAAPLGSR
jgi:histidine ammonia-lyase